MKWCAKIAIPNTEVKQNNKPTKNDFCLKRKYHHCAGPLYLSMSLHLEGVALGKDADDEEEMDDQDYLYGDLQDKARASAYAALKGKYSELSKEHESLKGELIEMRRQIQFLNEEKSKLETNIVAIYNTAVREMSRKDAQIAELRLEIVNKPK